MSKPESNFNPIVYKMLSNKDYMPFLMLRKFIQTGFWIELMFEFASPIVYQYAFKGPLNNNNKKIVYIYIF